MTNGVITYESAKLGLDRMEVDEIGLDANDRRMLRTMIEYYNGGPVGLDTLAAAIGEEAITLEDVYEPYLMQIGFLARTPRGRVATKAAYLHLGITPPESGTDDNQQKLF
jgi:Holliday junction DNA helicase RuvB